MRLLTWQFDDDGSWEANSALSEDGVPLVWRIVVCEDGTFDVSESASELCGDRKDAFYSLNDAQRWCVIREQYQLG